MPRRAQRDLLVVNLPFSYFFLSLDPFFTTGDRSLLLDESSLEDSSVEGGGGGGFFFWFLSFGCNLAIVTDLLLLLPLLLTALHWVFCEVNHRAAHVATTVC